MFCISQRAEHIWEGVSSATTRSRPIINTRDEPHADAERYRRLHVIVGDSNMSEYATFLKVGATIDPAAHARGPVGRAPRHDPREPDPGHPRDQPRHHLHPPGPPGQRPRGQRPRDPGRVPQPGAALRRDPKGCQPARAAGPRDVGALPHRDRERPAQARPRVRLGHQAQPHRGLPGAPRPPAGAPEGRADGPAVPRREPRPRASSTGCRPAAWSSGCATTRPSTSPSRSRRRPPGPGCAASSSARPRSASATTRSTGCT